MTVIELADIDFKTAMKERKNMSIMSKKIEDI